MNLQMLAGSNKVLHRRQAGWRLIGQIPVPAADTVGRTAQQKVGNVKEILVGEVVSINSRTYWVCGCWNSPLNDPKTKNCPWCMKSRPTRLAPDRAKRAAKSKTSASKRSKGGAAGKA